jgi:curli biogenesis system outer membrane secretion channel CsgG
MRRLAPAFLFLVVFLSCHNSNAQAKKRVAILGFNESAVRTQNYQIGQRVTNQLISQLAGSGNYEIVDREYLQRIVQEQNQSYGSRFDPAGAAKLGKLANANLLIIGQVDDFAAGITTENKQSFLGAKTSKNGDVTLRVTVRVIQVDTAAILEAPTAQSEQKGVLAQSTSYGQSGLIGMAASAHAAPANTSSIDKLIDQAVNDVSTQLAAKIAATALAMPATIVAPKFVGIEEGLVIVNKGQNAGLRIGDKFEVSRLIDTGMKDPDTGQSVVHKKKLCLFTISEVEDSISSGKCDGADTPQAGDIFIPAAKQ